MTSVERPVSIGQNVAQKDERIRRRPEDFSGEISKYFFRTVGQITHAVLRMLGLRKHDNPTDPKGTGRTRQK